MPQPPTPPADRNKRYRFGFLLATTVGNMTRYLNLRKYAERDPEVDLVWAPVNHYTPPDFHSPYRFLPEPLFLRARILEQAAPVLGQLGSLDAVMIHLFEGEVICALRSYLSRKPILISSTDEAPIVDRSTFPLYEQHLSKSVWRQRFRLAMDMWRVRRFDYFMPFSNWVGDILVKHCEAPAENVIPIHVGLDLELWQPAPKPIRPPSELPKILFVGGDFVRKGGELLLDVFSKRFQGRAELNLVTPQAPTELPPGVIAHRDFKPNDPRLIELYARSDFLVLPTRADFTPWALLEAMAMRLPVIGTTIGSMGEIIIEGQTGFQMKVDDAEALGAGIAKFLDDPALCRQMGERGRALVECRFSSETNVPLVLGHMKRFVDRARRH